MQFLVRANGNPMDYDIILLSRLGGWGLGLGFEGFRALGFKV